MIPELVRIASFMLPIPFMALFYVNTDSLNSLHKYALLMLFVPVFAQVALVDIGFKLELIIAYMIMVLFGTTIFTRRGWTTPRALSIAFCLAYFGSFLWEVPYHVYTIIVNGGIDGAFPMHLLYVFPMLFIYEKVKVLGTKLDIITYLAFALAFSSIGMLVLLADNVNIWNSTLNTLFYQSVTESIWMLSRIITVGSLFAIYARSRRRHTSKENYINV